MRLVFLGSGEFGLPTLRQLARTHDVQCVVTQPDRPAGRSLEHTPTPIGAWASEHLPNVPLLKPPDVNDAGIASRVRAIAADAWVVIAFGQKLGARLLADRFAINLHGSLLPRWRGAAPIQHALLAGDSETGNSVITLADRIDAGLILAQTRRAIDPTTTAGELHDLLSADGPAVVEQVLAAHAGGALRGRAQDASLVTRAGKLGRPDAYVNFALSAEECRRRINGLSPWPGVRARLRGADLKLLRSAVVGPSDKSGLAPSAADPGIIVDAEEGTVACGGGTFLRLLEVQAAGRRVMPWATFARGRRVARGEQIIGALPC